jgi:hypothetical protein
VLARLKDISGVDSCSVNAGGTLLQVMLQPGADSEKVATAAGRALSQQTGDRVGVLLPADSAAAALRREEWRSHGQVLESLAAGVQERTGSRRTLLFWLLALVFAEVGLGYLLLCLLRRDRGRAQIAMRSFGLQTR